MAYARCQLSHSGQPARHDQPAAQGGHLAQVAHREDLPHPVAPSVADEGGSERDRDRLAGVERAAREVVLAELYLDRLERPDEALAAAVRALGLSEHDRRAIQVLERLTQNVQTRARAAQAALEAEIAAVAEETEAEAARLREQEAAVKALQERNDALRRQAFELGILTPPPVAALP